MRSRSAVCATLSGMALLAACAKHDTGTAGNAAAPSSGAAPTAADHPAMPKPGLWSMTATTDGMPNPVTTQICIGSPAPGTNPFVPPPQAGQACKKQSVTKTAAGYSIAMDCAINGMIVTSSGEVSGDFSSNFKTVMKTRMSGPGLPAAMQTERTSTVEAKYLGACPAGMQPNTVRQTG